MSKLKVYNASAGSGKTYNLIREYLTLLLADEHPESYRHILAITFTNKAAGEMKMRLLQSLKKFSDPSQASKDQMFGDLASDLGLSTEELLRRSANALDAILHDYSALSISTIDTFTHRMLRTFSHDLDIPVNFEVEMDAAGLTTQAVDVLVSRAGEDKKLTKALLDYAMENVDDGKSWDLTHSLGDLAAVLNKEESFVPLKWLADKKLEDYEAFRRQLKKRVDAFESRAKDLGERGRTIIEQEMGGEKNITYGKSGIAGFFQKLKNTQIDKVSFGGRNINAFVEQGKYAAGKASQPDRAAVEAAAPSLIALYEEARQLWEAEASNYFLSVLLLQKMRSLGLLGEVEKELRGIKEENNILLISEFNRLITEEVCKQPVPFIYERMGERYRHYFIDEFQDTSSLQWVNLQPLVQNQLAQDGSAMLVGDGKQAIYRWRGGDPDQFVDLADPDHQDEAFSDKEVINLDTNYRSTSTIVDFCNKFFTVCADMMKRPSYSRLYAEGNQQLWNNKEEGFVEIKYIEGEGEEYDENQLEACYEEIRQLTADGWSKKDICILVRFNRHGRKIADYLMERGIAVVSSESLLLAAASSVKFLVACLRWLHDSEHQEARMTMMEFVLKQYPERFDGVDQFAWSREHLKSNPDEFITELQGRGFDFDREWWEAKPLYEGVEELVRLFELRELDPTYTLFFLDFVAEYVLGKSEGISGFLEYWDQKKDNHSIVIPEGSDAVQIMSVHKSKGLEFPVVIAAFCNWNAETDNRAATWLELEAEQNSGFATSYISLNKSLEKVGEAGQNVFQEHLEQVQLDNMNLLYVALTRPEHQLHILTSPKGRSRNLQVYFDAFLDAQGHAAGSDWSIGARRKKSDESSTVEAPLTLAEWDSCRWSEKLKMSYQAPEEWQVQKSDARSLGNIIHDIMGDIRSVNDVDRVVKRHLMEGLLIPSEQKAVSDLIYRVMDHPELSHYFTNKAQVLNERGIVRRDGSEVRPDRINIFDDGVSIIDYKTGQGYKKYHEQILKYRDALHELGHSVKEGLLVYLGKEIRIERVNL